LFSIENNKAMHYSGSHGNRDERNRPAMGKPVRKPVMSDANIDTNTDGNLSNVAGIAARGAAVNDVANAIANVAAGGWADGQSMSGIDSTARHMLNDAGVNITAAAAALRASQDEAQSHLANLDLHPDGRNARAADARAAGRDTANKSLADAETSINVAEALLFADSAPQWSDSTNARNGEMQRARDDARMVLDGAKNVTQAASALAEQDDVVSTLMTDGRWLDMYLTSKGYAPDMRQTIINAVNAKAIQARAARGNPSAALHMKLGKLRGAVGGTKSLANHDF
jgi:hypothetical protein